MLYNVYRYSLFLSLPFLPYVPYYFISTLYMRPVFPRHYATYHISIMKDTNGNIKIILSPSTYDVLAYPTQYVSCYLWFTYHSHLLSPRARPKTAFPICQQIQNYLSKYRCSDTIRYTYVKV